MVETLEKIASLFGGFVKVDATKHQVFAYFDETPDRDGEIMDYKSTKPHFLKWAKQQYDASNKLSWGNVRAMHGDIAAGKVIEFNANDEKRRFEFLMEIVDENEWQKCLQGVYTGISPSGDYLKKWKDGNFTRYEGMPKELSLGDRVSNPNAIFRMVKMDGSVIFAKVDKGEGDKNVITDLGGDWEKIAAREDISKAAKERAVEEYGNVDFADEKNKKYPLNTKEHVSAAWKYISMAKNASKYSAEDLKAINDKIKAAAKKFGITIAEEVKKIEKAGEMQKVSSSFNDRWSTQELRDELPDATDILMSTVGGIFWGYDENGIPYTPEKKRALLKESFDQFTEAMLGVLEKTDAMEKTDAGGDMKKTQTAPTPEEMATKEAAREKEIFNKLESSFGGNFAKLEEFNKLSKDVLKVSGEIASIKKDVDKMLDQPAGKPPIKGTETIALKKLADGSGDFSKTDSGSTGNQIDELVKQEDTLLKLHAETKDSTQKEVFGRKLTEISFKIKELRKQ